MAIGLFRRKKKEVTETKQPEKTPEQITGLERVCGDDEEVCKALWHTMFIDPRKIEDTLEDAAKKAASFEKKGNGEQARIWYHVAGGLALWKGNASKVKQYFTKCAKLAPSMDYELITKIPERAVAKAQEFYKEFLK